MKEFVMLFRQPSFDTSQMSPQAFEDLTVKWKEWADSLIAQGRLLNGNRLGTEGKVLRSDGVITDGPFVEVKERLGGFLLLRAYSLEEATALAHGCPVLNGQGSVEIRALMG